MSYKECFMRRHAAALRKARRTGQAEMRPSPSAARLLHEQERQSPTTIRSKTNNV